ncbi:MAG: HAD-IC family P-type ATPase, partial [Patescibacteria group bacterium]|nr:HAD-IC family P-type ATPase [Patescibacteria group bacterium]
MAEIFWHNLSIEEVAKLQRTNPKEGLTEKEVEIRQRKFGKNKLPEKKPPSKLKIFLDQFKSLLIYILIGVGIAVLILEKPPHNFIESGFVFLAILINAIFGFWEESKATKIFEKLKKIVKTKAIVIREGNKKEVFQEEIVSGDIIVLAAGDKVPADGRLIEAENLKISEAVLTGEWLSASKKIEVLPAETPLADRDNMVYAGCTIEAGQGKAVVTAIGKDTEMGKIALLIKEMREEKTPLQKKLMKFSKLIGGAICFICFFIFIIGVVKQQNPIEMFETAAAIAVGGIPEALPVVMTLILAIGMEKLAKKRGLMRKLASVETLGSTSIICCDKTKTLTQGKMEAIRFVTLEKNFETKPEIKDPLFILGLKIAVLCNEAFVENPKESSERWKIGGSPTDKALLLAGAKIGMLKPQLDKDYPLIQKLPFSPLLKYEADLRKEKEETFLYLS